MYLISSPFSQHVNIIQKIFGRQKNIDTNARHTLNDIDSMAESVGTQASDSPFNTRGRSDMLMNYFLVAYFLLGLVFAVFYNTWLVAVCVGGMALIVYYAVKAALPHSSLYQYVLSAVLGVFMA